MDRVVAKVECDEIDKALNAVSGQHKHTAHAVLSLLRLPMGAGTQWVIPGQKLITLLFQFNSKLKLWTFF